MGASPHILIAASRKSSGKTSLSIGLTRALVRRNINVQTFKKGPDYIDPLWLQQASGNPCFNLDFNTMGEDEIVDLFQARFSGCDLALIETNKGLFDGLDLHGSDSNAQLAKILKSPVVLVIDTTGMTRGIAPLLHGYSHFDPDIKISGVILNKTGGSRHEGKLRAAVEEYTDMKVLGALGRNDALAVRERHLGLTTPGDNANPSPLIERLADAVEAGIDLNQIIAIAATAGDLPDKFFKPNIAATKPTKLVKIAIPRDAAFGFYYPDDLEALENAGAELCFFNALKDEKLPECDGLFIGGGFPETHMKALAENLSLRAEIRQAIEGGLPAYAECGGLMLLCRKIQWQGETAEMVGVIPADAVVRNRPQGRGFARLAVIGSHPWEDTNGDEYSVHEFHYAGLENISDDLSYAYKVTRGHGIDGQRDGIVMHNLLANFCHFRHTCANPWATRFVEFVASKKS